MDTQPYSPADRFWKLLAKKLASEITVEELQELNEFILTDPELNYQADLFTGMWQQIPPDATSESEHAFMRHLLRHKNEFFTEDHQEKKISSETEQSPKQNYLHRLAISRKKVAVILLIILISATGLYLFTPTSSPAKDKEAVSSVITKNGNRTKIVLADGSQVWLNAGSNLEYNNALFNKELREVSLNGEAYFDVAKNAEKPFIIHTKKMDIRVIGTAFNVRAYSNEKVTEAALIRGSIEVTLKNRKNQKIILKPNEKISIANSEDVIPDLKNNSSSVGKNTPASVPQVVIKEIKPNPVYNIIGEIAWTQNKLLFEDETLENIALIIERWFGKNVIIENDMLKNNRYYGNFENESLELVLASLKLSRPFNYRIENDTVIIY